MSTEQEQERAIQAAGATAPRLRPADIDAAIMSEHYFTAWDGALSLGATGKSHGEWDLKNLGDTPQQDALKTLTFCVLVLRNGFTVTGESACASPANFHAEIGREIAREKARDKIWELEGYLLKQQLYRASLDQSN